MKLTPLVAILLALNTPHGAGADYVRLGHDVVPTFQSIHLTLDADQPTYRGTVRIGLEVRKAVEHFLFHSEGQVLERVVLSGAGGTIGVDVRPEGDDVVRATPAAKLAPGRYVLEVAFTNFFDTRASSLFRIERDGLGYVFSHFEPTDARQAFPCFDEPIFKIPFDVTLTVPERHLAISNAPVGSETVDAGWRTVIFERTPPMPTYLVAMVAGPLETVPIPGLGVPGRVVTVRGQSRLAGVAVAVTPPILKALEAYFDRPYPFPKLDLIAVPELPLGGMENPGTVTFYDSLLLVDPRIGSTRQMSALVGLTAHELSHMWFGDLVTMEWWHDMWLKEAFASWMGTKISAQVYPEYEADLFGVRSAQWIMAADARTTTTAIRHPVESLEDFQEDLGLVYDKGEAILGMFESWIGPEAFRRGVLAYLEDHVWGNAAAEELWRALEKASGEPVRQAMAGFIEQPGVPRIDVERLGGNRVKISQRRFYNFGTRAAPGSWRIPLRIKYASAGVERFATVLLETESRTLELAGPEPPEWIFPNAGARGYYRWSLPAEELRKLAARAREVLEPGERIALIGNLGALLDAGTLGGDVYLRILADLADDPEPLVVYAVLGALGAARPAFVPEELEPAWAVYVRRALAPVLARFGREKTPGEKEAVAMVRPLLLWWLGYEAGDPEVLGRSRALARAYVGDATAIDPALISTVLRLAALQGDGVLFDVFRESFEHAEVPMERSLFIAALGSFEDPELHGRALRYALEGPLRPEEILEVVWSAPSSEGRDRAFRFFTEHYKTIAERLPPTYAVYLPQLAAGCSLERLEQAKRFFGAPERRTEGTDRQVAKLAEQVTDCAGMRAREGAAAAEYLRGVAGGR